MIKVSHETPRCLLEDSIQFNDYQYALAHLRAFTTEASLSHQTSGIINSLGCNSSTHFNKPASL